MIPWQSLAWREEFEAWIRAQIAQRGATLTGPIEQPHIRAWSTVLRAPTSAGALYAKACAPALAHEPALTAFLSMQFPSRLPVVLGMEPARAWFLMQDSGQPLRAINKQTRSLAGWHDVLRRYAQLQIEAIPHQHALLVLGAMDRRLAILPGLYESLLQDTAALMVGEPDGFTPDERERALALAPAFRADCAALAAAPIPQTLHHDDFHDGNIFVQDEHFTFADWGESCITHPFFTLVVTLRNIAWVFGLSSNAAELADLRDAYLREWLAFAPLDELRRIAVLADRVGRVNRALTWHHVVKSLPEPYFSEERSSVPGWLQEYLAA
ncbi:MAG TPA: phosphotransferase [Thermoflexales bacterium]|nr:phosphotransferase [Thermoflexales bacterium]HQW35814.1 phosphotransferase [Thermoflexales bacterium]